MLNEFTVWPNRYAGGLRRPADCRTYATLTWNVPMLNFHDSVAAIDEPKTARMEQRTKPRVKQQIQRTRCPARC